VYEITCAAAYERKLPLMLTVC